MKLAVIMSLKVSSTTPLSSTGRRWIFVTKSLMSFVFQNTHSALPIYLISGPVITYEFVIFQNIFKEIAGNKKKNRYLLCVIDSSLCMVSCTNIVFG